MRNDDREDRELRDLASRLGARAEQRLDVERTAQAVLARLARPEARVPWTWRPAAWLRIAAMLALVVGAGIVVRGARPGPERVATAGAAGVDLSDLSPDDLTEMLRTFDQSLDQEPVGAEAGLDDLTAPELRRLLRSLES